MNSKGARDLSYPCDQIPIMFITYSVDMSDNLPDMHRGGKSMSDARFEILSAKIKDLYSIVNELEEQFPGRHFTPDGHLVGSIGEVLAASYYGLRLLPASSQTHDAISKEGKMVQIKATQVGTVSLSSEPEHLVILRILRSGDADEIYNGPGRTVWEASGRMQKNGQRSISVSKLKALMNNVPLSDRLERLNK